MCQDELEILKLAKKPDPTRLKKDWAFWFNPNKEFWLELCPNLSITDDLLSDTTSPPYDIDDAISERCSLQYKEDGYFQSQPIIPDEITQHLANTVIKVSNQGLPALFCLVYDDFWKPLRRLNQLLEPIMGKDYTIFALIDGQVKFENKHGRKVVSVYPAVES